jgi:hypothetical protein
MKKVLEEFHQEIAIQGSATHPNIVKITGKYFSKNRKPKIG